MLHQICMRVTSIFIFGFFASLSSQIPLPTNLKFIDSPEKINFATDIVISFSNFRHFLVPKIVH